MRLHTSNEEGLMLMRIGRISNRELQKLRIGATQSIQETLKLLERFDGTSSGVASLAFQPF